MEVLPWNHRHLLSPQRTWSDRLHALSYDALSTRILRSFSCMLRFNIASYRGSRRRKRGRKPELSRV